MSEEFDPADYSFVVKRRGNPQKPWRWEIYCAGKSAPLERSPVFFESMAEAAKEGKRALGHQRQSRASKIAPVWLGSAVLNNDRKVGLIEGNAYAPNSTRMPGRQAAPFQTVATRRQHRICDLAGGPPPGRLIAALVVLGPTRMVRGKHWGRKWLQVP